jgi:hypothetical protein
MGILIHLLIVLLVIGIVAIIIRWALGSFSLPGPVGQIIWLVFVIICLIVVLNSLWPLLGGVW